MNNNEPVEEYKLIEIPRCRDVKAPDSSKAVKIVNITESEADRLNRELVMKRKNFIYIKNN